MLRLLIAATAITFALASSAFANPSTPSSSPSATAGAGAEANAGAAAIAGAKASNKTSVTTAQLNKQSLAANQEAAGGSSGGNSLTSEGDDIGGSWGFRYKTTGLIWMKTRSGGKPHVGLGYWGRGGSEQTFLFTRGAPKRKSAAVRKVIVAPVREHSRKPDEAHERIEKLLPGPYLELFARAQRPGWTTWGNQVDRFAYDFARFDALDFAKAAE